MTGVEKAPTHMSENDQKRGPEAVKLIKKKGEILWKKVKILPFCSSQTLKDTEKQYLPRFHGPKMLFNLEELQLWAHTSRDIISTAAVIYHRFLLISTGDIKDLTHIKKKVNIF